MSRGGGDDKNPYSNVGRDKFSVVLSELEAKKKRIMARAGSSSSQQDDEETVVRFKYSTTNKDWIPIVVRPKHQPPPARKSTRLQQQQQQVDADAKPAIRTARAKPAAANVDPRSNNLLLLQQIQEDESSELVTESTTTKSVPKPADVVMNCHHKGEGEGEGAAKKKKKKCSSTLKLIFYWDVHYWQVVVVMVLACLLLGRVFAICCIAMFWYALPIILIRDHHGNGNGGNLWRFHFGEILLLQNTSSPPLQIIKS